MIKITIENMQSIANPTQQQEAIKTLSQSEDDLFYLESHYLAESNCEIDILLIPSQKLALVATSDSLTRIEASEMDEAIASYLTQSQAHG